MKKKMKKLYLRCNNMVARILDCGKITIHTFNKEDKCMKLRILGKTIYSSKKIPLEKDKKDVPVFYLKVNRDAAYTIDCIQGWINIINEIGADFYFVCDNKMLEYKILRKCYFRNGDIKFISSIGKPINKVANSLYTGPWENATHAHLTPFYHARKRGIKKFWNIDADDTTILLNPVKVAEVLGQVEKLSEKECISAISLDMWRSRTYGKHWSLGVLYINDNVDFCHVFESNKDLSWIKKVEGYDDAFNLDWFFSYLKLQGKIKIETFYIDNCYFIHWGNFILDPTFSGIYLWKDGKVIFPILKDIYKNTEMGVLDIADCYKISVEIDEQECIDMLENKICGVRFFTEKKRALVHAYNFANGLKEGE
jgi:hypothetical protein